MFHAQMHENHIFLLFWVCSHVQMVHWIIINKTIHRFQIFALKGITIIIILNNLQRLARFFQIPKSASKCKSKPSLWHSVMCTFLIVRTIHQHEICNSQGPTGQVCYFLPCHSYRGVVQCFLKDHNGL